MYKYACMNNIAKAGLDEFGENYEQTDDLSEADGILVRSAKLHEIDIPPHVKCIVRAGVGVNNIPEDQCNKKGIVIFNTPGANANAVKEMVIAGMLLASRDIIGGAQYILNNANNEDIKFWAEKQKKQFAGTEIAGKSLGIIGLGAIGVLVANAALALGMNVYGYDPYLSVRHALGLDRSIRRVSSLDEIYKDCDFITIHIPLVDSTKHTIDADALSKMRNGVILLNFSRDILCDEEAVIAGIEAGKIRRYVTDFANPTVAGHDNVIVTPHLGASTQEAEENSARMAVSEMKDFLENGNICHSVNYSNCEMGVCKTDHRITICHKNVPNMIARFTQLLSEYDVNIEKMLNSSKGEFAYTMIDINCEADSALFDALNNVPDIIRVRII